MLGVSYKPIFCNCEFFFGFLNYSTLFLWLLDLLPCLPCMPCAASEVREVTSQAQKPNIGGPSPHDYFAVDQQMKQRSKSQQEFQYINVKNKTQNDPPLHSESLALQSTSLPYFYPIRSPTKGFSGPIVNPYVEPVKESATKNYQFESSFKLANLERSEDPYKESLSLAASRLSHWRTYLNERYSDSPPSPSFSSSLCWPEEDPFVGTWPWKGTHTYIVAGCLKLPEEGFMLYSPYCLGPTSLDCA